jgi:Raf kinase inhibitor-like YbhB/YbcL family protein
MVACKDDAIVETEEDLGGAEETTLEEAEEEVAEVDEEEKTEEDPEEETEIPEEEIEEPEEEEEVEEMIEEEDVTALMIESPAFNANEKIPAKFTCDADNINPQLDISGIPQNTASLVLIVDDPDAPGGTWVHWTLWNLDPGTISISENSVPQGVIEGVTDFGVPGYGGPCPPSGTHRYFFKLFALDITLDLDSSASASDIESAIQGHVLDSAELVGLYGE